MQECDTLVIVGSSFPYMEFYPKPGQAKCVQIDIDPARIGLRYPVDVGLVGDCQRVLQALLPLLQRKKDRGFLEKAQKAMKEWNELMEERGTRTDKPMKPQVVAYHAQQVPGRRRDHRAATCGTVTTWAARYLADARRHDVLRLRHAGDDGQRPALRRRGGGRLPGPAGRRASCGDGGFTMLMGEMATLVKYKLPVKVIIIKNNVAGPDQVGADGLRGQPGVRRASCSRSTSPPTPGPAARPASRWTTRPGPRRCCGEAFRAAGAGAGRGGGRSRTSRRCPGKITTEQAWHFAEGAARARRTLGHHQDGASRTRSARWCKPPSAQS